MPLKDSLSKIAKTVGDSAANVAKKSGDIVEMSKLSSNISSLQDEKEKIYIEIGKLIYNKFDSGEIYETDITEECNKIKNIENNISSIKGKIFELKNVKVCPNCGNILKYETAYCPQCGTKQEIPIEEETKEANGSTDLNGENNSMK